MLFYFLFCEAAENFQISFQESATTEMDGIYSIVIYCSIFVVFSSSLPLALFAVFLVLVYYFCYLITNITSLLVLKSKSLLVEILIKHV